MPLWRIAGIGKTSCIPSMVNLSLNADLFRDSLMHKLETDIGSIAQDIPELNIEIT